MKADHRHQLQTNVLADRMGRLYQGMKSSSTKTSALVWTFIILTVATFGLWRYWAYAAQTESSALWTQVNRATDDPELITPDLNVRALADIADNNRGTLAGRTAEFQLARLQFHFGQQHLIANRDSQAVEQIKGALKRYEDLAKRCADAPMLAQEALMGIAKAKESLIGVTPEKEEKDFGTLDDALAAYRRLIEKYPDSVLGETAAKRLKEIEAKPVEIEKWYKDLNAQAATKPSMDLKVPGDSSATPPLLDLPSPDFNLPPPFPEPTKPSPDAKPPGSEVAKPPQDLKTSPPEKKTVPDGKSSTSEQKKPAQESKVPAQPAKSDNSKANKGKN